MDVSIETLEGLQRKMLVVIPASRVEERVNEKLEEALKVNERLQEEMKTRCAEFTTEFQKLKHQIDVE